MNTTEMQGNDFNKLIEKTVKEMEETSLGFGITNIPEFSKKLAENWAHDEKEITQVLSEGYAPLTLKGMIEYELFKEKTPHKDTRSPLDKMIDKACGVGK